MTKKSARKRNEDYYKKNSEYIKIQKILRKNQNEKSLTEIKSLTEQQLTDLKIPNEILKLIFVKQNNSLSDQSVESETQTEIPKTFNTTFDQRSEQAKQNDQAKTDQVSEQLKEFSNENSKVIDGELKDGISVVYPNWLNKLQENTIPYMERNNEIQFVIDYSLDTEKITALIGESGIGKTLLCKTIAQKLNSPFVFVGCHDNMTSDDLEGSIQLLPNQKSEIQTKYVLGGIAQAIHCANNSKTKLCVLCFDELNTLLPTVQKLLNNRTNFREGIEINSIGLKLKLNPDCKIICLATLNPAHYSGTYPLNIELRSKLICFEMEDLNDHDMAKLMKDTYPDQLPADLVDQVIQFKNLMNSGHRDGSLDRGIDPRQVMSFCNAYVVKGLDKKRTHDESLKNAIHGNFYGNYSSTGQDEMKKLVKENIESCFGVTDLKVM